MKPLITIETVPISIEYVEKKTTHTSSESASLRISQQDDRMTIQSNPINIPMDSFKPSSAVDWRNLSYTATAQYSGDGNLSMNVQMENYDTSSFNYNQVSRGIDNIINFVPKVSSNSSAYGFESMHINFDMSQLAGGLPSVDNMGTSFLPPDLELKVVEQPKVIIKYVGGPLYIPRSADPNYVPPEEYNQIFDGKPNLDIKA
jgi:hypothetical protein